MSTPSFCIPYWKLGFVQSVDEHIDFISDSPNLYPAKFCVVSAMLNNDEFFLTEVVHQFYMISKE